MSISRLEYLFKHFIDQTCTEQEKEEFMQFISDAQYDDALKSMMQSAWKSSSSQQGLSEEKAASIFKNIINTGTPAVSIQQEPSRKNKTVWYLAAASIILLAGIGLWRFFSNSSSAMVEKNAVVVHPNQDDVKPGGDKAMLTLADGSTIILDQVMNGTISQQGNSSILKTGGELVYDPLDGDPSTKNITYNTISTPRGGQYKLVLSDGTRVWLNAASSLRFPTSFEGDERKVEVTGEAYFEVSRNVKMPFKVLVNNETEVQVLGTQFNVMAYTDEDVIKTTLVEGRVKINKGNASHLLKPGQQAQSTNKNIRVLNDVDVDRVVAWKNGLFDFDNDHIIDIMRQLSRWYDVDIFYSGKAPEHHYTGSIRRQVNLSQVLHMFELVGNVEFKIEGKKIVVKEK